MIARMLILTVTLLAAAMCIRLGSQIEPTPARAQLSGFPAQLGLWTGRSQPPLDERTVATLGVDDYVNRLYANPAGTTVGLYVAYYESQRQGDAIHSPLNCLPGAGWTPVQRGRIHVRTRGGVSVAQGRSPADARAAEINRLVVQKGLEKLLVFYWYQSQGRVIASEYWGKVFLVLDAMRTHRSDAALIRVVAPIDPSRPGAEGLAEHEAVGFIENLFPALLGFLPV